MELRMKQGAASLKMNKAETRYAAHPALILAGVPVLIGFWGILEQELRLSEAGISPVAGCLISAAVMVLCALFKRTDRVHRIILIAAAAALAVFLIAGSTALLPSFGAWGNRVTEWLFLRTGIYRMPFENAGNGMWMLVPAAVGAGALCALFHRVLAPLLQIIAAGALVVLILTGMVDFSLFCCLFLAGSVLSFAVSASRRGRVLIFAAAAAAVFAVLLALIFASAGGAEGFASAGDALRDSVHRMRYESTSSAMPEGKLKDLPPYRGSQEEVLKVTMSSWTPLYLRGFSGSEYTGQAWEDPDPELILDDAELLYNLQTNYFFPAGQTGEAFAAAGEGSAGTITVENTGACREYAIVPYGTRIGAGQGLRAAALPSEGTKDADTVITGAEIYPVSDSYLLLYSMNEQDAAASPDYLSAELAYRTFVYEHYLYIPENIEALLRECGLYGNEGVSTTQARAEIIALLRDYLTYDLTASTPNGDQDFLEYVLKNSRKGYDVHFATAAVMMMRSYGIPARYAEGYLAPSKQTSMLADGQTLVLTQLNAHAWAEFYLDGVGWIPFDPTPGYQGEIHYALPAGEGNVEETPSKLNPNYQKPQEEQEEIRLDDSDRKDIKNTADPEIPWLLIILAAVAAFIVFLVIRAAILRRKLREEARMFSDPAPDRAASAMLVYSRRALACAGLMEEDRSICESAELLKEKSRGDIPAEMISSAAELENELWYSSHDMSEDSRAAAQRWLDGAVLSWKKRVPLPKRLLQRFIGCRVL